MVRVKNLYYDYFISKEKQIPALRDVNFSVKEGECVAIIGQNGSGKTTLVKHFNGLLKPTKGDVFIFGENTKEKSIAELSKKAGYVFQNPDHQIFAETVRAEVAFGPTNLGFPPEDVEKKVDMALEMVGLKELEKVSPFSLSKGQKQGLAVASILAMDTDIIVLDEPTTGRDYLQSKKIMDLAKKKNREGKTLIFITHDMQLVAEYSQRVVVMCQGRFLLDGSPREIFKKIDVLSSTYLRPPQITKLSLDLWGDKKVACTINEFCVFLSNSLDEKKTS